MAKYTTLVRSVCEELTNIGSSGFGKVDEIIRAAVPIIFTSPVEIFTPECKELLLRKTLKHYYMREIGFETVGLWRLYMNMRLEEIAPYYDFMYSHALTNQDLYKNTDVRTGYTGTDTGRGTTTNDHDESTSHDEQSTMAYTGSYTDTTSGTSKGKDTSESSAKSSGSTSGNNTGKDTTRASDTPQGGLAGIESNTYLTNASIVDRTENTSGSTSGNTSGNTTSTSENTENSTLKKDRDATDTGTRTYSDSTRGGFTNTDTNTLQREYVQTVTGLTGKSPIEIFSLIKDTYYNIDLEVINSFADLFINIY